MPEPRETAPMRPEDVRPEWVAAAQEAYASAPQKRDGKPTRMIYALAAVYPAIEHQVGAKVAEEGTPVYRERAHLVALLASLYPSVLSWNDPNEPDWPVVYVDSPGGQLSWHISPNDIHLFGHLPIVEPDDPRAQWDGHTTDEKYQRIADLARGDRP